MSDDLRRLWAERPEAVRSAGRELAAVGRLLADGRIDEAIARVDALQADYPEWAELDRAAADLDGAANAQARAEAARQAVLSLVGKGLVAVFRGAIGL